MKATTRAAAAKNRHAEALRLRIQGLSYERIAAILGYETRGGVCKAIDAELAAIPAPNVEAVRRVECERLDTLLAGVWDRAVKGTDDAAIQSVLKISARRAKLMGLDAPVKTELTGADGGPLHVEHDAADQVIDLLDRLAAAGGTDPTDPSTPPE